MINFNHKPVLLKESVDLLNVSAGEKYIDATVGGGGHTKEILKKGGIVLGIDQDEEAIEYLKNSEFRSAAIGGQSSELKERLILANGNFADIKKIAHLNNFDKVAGVIFDLGLSSYQIDSSGRGFSFMRNEPLDMRMNKKSDLTAYKIINKWSKEELYDLFSKMGEERFSLPIADSITSSRRVKEIRTTFDLVEIIKKAAPKNTLNEVLARIFQSIRMAVNLENANLLQGLTGAFDLLSTGGRLAVISFHSLEDRQVKKFFKEKVKKSKAVIINKKVVTPGEEEIKNNKRSRSAKLRVLEKTEI